MSSSLLIIVTLTTRWTLKYESHYYQMNLRFQHTQSELFDFQVSTISYMIWNAHIENMKMDNFRITNKFPAKYIKHATESITIIWCFEHYRTTNTTFNVPKCFTVAEATCSSQFGLARMEMRMNTDPKTHKIHIEYEIVECFLRIQASIYLLLLLHPPFTKTHSVPSIYDEIYSLWDGFSRIQSKSAINHLYVSCLCGCCSMLW